MSMCICKECFAYIDSDDDPECFVEVGNMRRMNWTIILCDRCREEREMEAERNASEEAQALDSLPQS